MPDPVTRPTPHLDKLDAALVNPKCLEPDRVLLLEAKARYTNWLAAMNVLTSHGRTRVDEMVRLLNEYKDFLEVEIIAKRASASSRGRRANSSSTTRCWRSSCLTSCSLM